MNPMQRRQLIGLVIGTILLVALVAFVRREIAMISYALQSGPEGIFRLLVTWTFDIIQLALLVRVVSSWFQISSYSPWVRWAYLLSEPILRPLREFIPPLGMMDVTPLVAYFLLSILQSFFMKLM